MRFTTVLIEAVLLAVTVLSFPAIVDADCFPLTFVESDYCTETVKLSCRSLGIFCYDDDGDFLGNYCNADETIFPYSDACAGAAPTCDPCFPNSQCGGSPVDPSKSVAGSFFQDNLYSNPDPVEIPGFNNLNLNRWIYSGVPLQFSFGINIDAKISIAGWVDGFCESKPSSQSGYCHFTYAFYDFDLKTGAPVFYASFTAEGATKPTGPSMLTILGGTGALVDFVGTVTLWPVSIDEPSIKDKPFAPYTITRDDSLFLGNSVGYEATIELREVTKPIDPTVYSGSVASPVLGTVSSIPAFAGLSIGTEYLYKNSLFDAEDINSRLIPLQVDNQETRIMCASIEGNCIRIKGPQRDFVQGYCLFEYNFSSCEVANGAVIGDGEKLGSFTANGIIVSSEDPGQLIVTGGTGFMIGATGLVEIIPQATDYMANPPSLVPPAKGSDIFIGVEAWVHYFEVTAPAASADPPLSVKSSKKGKGTKTKGAKKSSKKGKKP